MSKFTSAVVVFTYLCNSSFIFFDVLWNKGTGPNIDSFRCLLSVFSFIRLGPGQSFVLCSYFLRKGVNIATVILRLNTNTTKECVCLRITWDISNQYRKSCKERNIDNFNRIDINLVVIILAIYPICNGWENKSLSKKKHKDIWKINFLSQLML